MKHNCSERFVNPYYSTVMDTLDLETESVHWARSNYSKQWASEANPSLARIFMVFIFRTIKVARELGVDDLTKGLSWSDATRRLHQFGPNDFCVQEQESLLSKYLEQFQVMRWDCDKFTLDH